MAKFYILVLILLFFSTCDRADCAKKLKNGTLYFRSVPVVDVSSTLSAEFDGKGLEPWYDIAKSFIHTVQKDDLPYDEIEKMKDDKDFDVQEFLKGWELPFLAVFAIGFLFAIIVPIVGFCFCCCRCCCGNCGGEMVQKDSSKASLKRAIFAMVLSIITLLMFTGCLMAFVSNDRITDTVESYKTTPIRAIRDTEQYFNQTLNVVTDYVIKDVLDVLGIVMDDVVGLPGNITVSVVKKLTDLVRKPLVSVVELANQTKEMGELLQTINSTTIDLKLRFIKLSDDIEGVREDLKRQNVSEGSALNTGANFSTLPNVTDQLNRINDINNDNLAENAQKGLDEFDTIEQRIKSETDNTTDSIKSEIDEAKDEFTNEIKDDIEDKVDELILSNSDDWVKEIEDTFEDQIEPYDKYRYYAGVGLTCLILLPVVLMALGLLCGIFGHDKGAEPTERGAISNIGGNCLMAAVGFMFIFVFFLMLFTAICFIVGAHLEKGCYSVREETLYKDFLDNPKYWDGDYILGDKVFQNGSLKLTIEEILASCRNNDALYQAIQGYRKWNLTEKFNVKDKLGDIENKLNNFNVSISNQTILNDDTTKGLRDLRNSGVGEIDFDQFFNETGKDVLNNTKLDELIETVSVNASSATRNISERLERIQREANSMNSDAKWLKENVTKLKDLGENIKIDANDTLNRAEEADRSFKARVNEDVWEAVVHFSRQILGYIDQTTVWATKLVENELGRCRILADVYDAAVNLVCRDTVYPFNGFWFAIGFCLFFYIPAIIFSVKLAKHYRRMRFEEGFDRHDGMEMHDRNKAWLNQGNAVYPK